ncbi:hypothetical protein F5883DRAFT_535165, partial [Diaporthe sp. PMI_573]
MRAAQLVCMWSMSATCQPWGSPQKPAPAPQLHLCTSAPAYYVYNRENTGTSSPLLSPQRLSVSSSMTPGRRARARRARLDRRLKVPDGERRSGPAPVISCEGPGAAPPRAHIRGLPGRPPMLPVPLLCPLSQHLCALNQGPLTRYLLSFQMTSMALPCLEAPPAFIWGNKIKKTCFFFPLRRPRHQLPPASEAPHQHHHHQQRVQTQNPVLHRPIRIHLHRVAREPTQNPIGLFQVVIQCILSDLSPAYTHSLTHTRKPLLFPVVYFPFLSHLSGL